jgi:hypothetical protein
MMSHPSIGAIVETWESRILIGLAKSFFSTREIWTKRRTNWRQSIEAYSNFSVPQIYFERD